MSRDPERDAALERLAESVRSVIDRVVRTDAPTHELLAAATLADQLAAALEPHTRAAGPSQLPSVRHAREPHQFLPRSMVSGTLNPLAPPVRMEVHPDHVVGRATFTNAYEGPPGYVHGAMVAGVLDQVLAFANLASGHPGFTATLTIRYHLPTPLFREIRFEARHARTDGKRIHATGQVFDGDTLTAEAEGLFVSIDMEKARAYFPHTNDFSG